MAPPSSGGLERLFRPRTVAVFGSVKPGKIGHQLLTQLVQGGFPGRLYAVNPKAESPPEFRAVTGVASASQIPGSLDLALVAVPAAHVQSVVEECGSREAGAAVLFTSGFGEVGRVAEERALVETARRHNLRLVGPNCAGIMNTAASLCASIEVPARPGKAAFITQSGAVGGAVLATAETRGIGFSKFVSYGNRADIGEVELLDFLAEDPETEIIALYLESVQDGRAFMEALRRVAKHKPVLIIKAGRTSSGLRAAGSHTGSLAGSDRVFEAMVRQSGALRVPGIEEMLDLCEGFASLPLPRGESIAVVTNSGGPGILTSDRAEELGLRVQETSSTLRSALGEFLPPYCAMGNPIDLTVEGTRENYRRVLEQVLGPEYDAVIAINVATPFLDSDALAEGICEGAGSSASSPPKPVAAVFMAGRIVESGRARLARAGIPTFPTGERAVYVLARMREYARLRVRQGHGARGGDHPPRPVASPESGAGAGLVAPLAQGAAHAPVTLPLETPILEPEAVSFLEDEGFPFPPHAFVTEAGQLDAAVAQVGLPLVMKVVSPRILHKSDVGGVLLGLESLEQVRQAFRAMRDRFSRDGLRGVMLYRHLSGGVELIAGLKQDPDFGAVVLAGSGGVLAELLDDVAMRVAPFDREEALAMLAELKAVRLLRGFRGQPPRDTGAAADLLAGLARLGMRYPQIRELDFNPVFVLEQGLAIADVRILGDD